MLSRTSHTSFLRGHTLKMRSLLELVSKMNKSASVLPLQESTWCASMNADIYFDCHSWDIIGLLCCAYTICFDSGNKLPIKKDKARLFKSGILWLRSPCMLDSAFVFWFGSYCYVRPHKFVLEFYMLRPDQKASRPDFSDRTSLLGARYRILTFRIKRSLACKYLGFTNPLVKKVRIHLVEGEESYGCKIFRIHRPSGWNSARMLRVVLSIRTIDSDLGLRDCRFCLRFKLRCEMTELWTKSNV